MGAKKIGISDCDYGKELFLPVNKLEDSKEGTKTSREKIVMDMILDREITVSLLDGDKNVLNTTLVEAPKEKCLLKIILASTTVGNSYYIKADSSDGDLKKLVFFEPQR